MNSELGQAELNSRFEVSLEGRLDGLLREMMVNAQESPGHRSKVMNFKTGAKVACHRVRMGEVSRARQCLTGASLAPGTQEALEKMQNQCPQEGRPTIARGGP